MRVSRRRGVIVWLRALWFIMSRARELMHFSSSRCNRRDTAFKATCSDARRALCNRALMRRRRRKDILEPYHPREFDGDHQRNDHAEQPPKARRTGHIVDPRSSRATTGKRRMPHESLSTLSGTSMADCRRWKAKESRIQRRRWRNAAKPEMTTS